MHLNFPVLQYSCSVSRTRWAPSCVTFIFAGSKFPFLASEVHRELQLDLFASKGMKVFMQLAPNVSNWITWSCQEQSNNLVTLSLSSCMYPSMVASFFKWKIFASTFFQLGTFYFYFTADIILAHVQLIQARHLAIAINPVLTLCLGLKIISGESLDIMTNQIHFNSVTYCFWLVKLYKTGAHEPKLALYISKKVVA